MLSAEQLSEIVASADGKKVHQSRRCPRVRHDAKMTIYRKAANPADMALAVRMCDVSARGCSFTVNQKLNRGSQFIIRFSRKDQPPVAILCTSMHCRAYGDGFRVGAEFTCQVDLKRGTHTAVPSEDEMDRIRNSILD